MFTIVISGCSTNGALQKPELTLNLATEEWGPESSRSLILGTAIGTGLNKRTSFGLSFILDEPRNLNRRFFIGHANHSAAKAGTYRPDFLYFKDLDRYYDLGSALNSDPRYDVVARKGEMIYVGHIKFNPRGSKLRIVVEDRLQEYIEKELPAHLRPYEELIEKKILDLPELLEFNSSYTRIR